MEGTLLGTLVVSAEPAARTLGRIYCAMSGAHPECFVVDRGQVPAILERERFNPTQDQVEEFCEGWAAAGGPVILAAMGDA